ncbi:hypothetical protein HDU99_001283 [Rhizoclosmatium hyalinum]|nr:hypothetical protein HDU99_001283 [Rhizoclosmatium hyalinum]
MPPKRSAESPSAPPKKTHPFFAAKEKKEEIGNLEWKVIGNSLLVGTRGPQTPSATIAAFDFDGTITLANGTHVFSKSPDDWMWVAKNTREKLLDAHKRGFRIVILSNQKGLLDEGKKAAAFSKEAIFKGKVANVAASLDIPLLVLAALDDSEYRKPQTGMWDYLVSHCNGGISPDLERSFYVGDAAGRPDRTVGGKVFKKDHSAADYRMALNLGITFHVPEAFYEMDPLATKHLPTWDFDPLNFVTTDELYIPSDIPLIPTDLDGPELILLVGPPASGKTSFTKKHLLPKNYVHINQDTLKDRKKCIKGTIESLKAGKSVAVDNTNPTAAVRKEYIAAAKECGVTRVRAFYFTASVDLCLHNNYVRAKWTKGKGKGIERERISTIVFHTFRKNFEEPNVDKEGLVEVRKINFVPEFESEEEKAVWSKWYL